VAPFLAVKYDSRMAFRGNVAGMSLEEVIGFLANGQVEGALEVESGSDASIRLYFLGDGRIFFPYSARRGTYSLGKILRHTGVLSREAMERYVAEVARKRKADLIRAEADDDALGQARHRQFTEELQDLFLWGHAEFEFVPGQVPPRAQQDLAAGRGLVLDAQALLFEVARRADERRRIGHVLPSGRLILVTRGSNQEALQRAQAAVVEALGAQGVDVAGSPFEGSQRVEDLLHEWGVPHHDALSAVADLIEAGHLLPLSAEAAQEDLARSLEDYDLARAARLVSHLLEVRRGTVQGAERFEPGPERAYLTSPCFQDAPEVVLTCRLEGPQVFCLARALIERPVFFTLVVHGKRRQLRLAGLPGELLLRLTHATTPDALHYLAKAKLVTKEQAEQVARGETTVDALASAEGMRFVNHARLVEELASLAFLPEVEVELRNRQQPGPTLGTELKVALRDETRRELSQELETWGQDLRRVPGEDALFVSGPRAEGGGSAVRFFRRFTLGRSVGELRRRARVRPVEFVRFVSQGVQRGFLREPHLVELQAAAKRAQREGHDLGVLRLARAGAALGYAQAFAQYLTGVREASHGAALRPGMHDAEPAIQGDLDGIGLAAVLQALRDNRRTGTLAVTAAEREERLYFFRGDAYILRFEDPEAEAFAQLFLGDEVTEQVSELAASNARGMVDESQLNEVEVRELKGQFLDILFWENAAFSYFPDDLPEEFFDPGAKVTKVALDTRRFLLEAMRCMSEWDGIWRTLTSGCAVFRFAEGRKLEAIQQRGQAEVLMLIDGRRTFNDLVRTSGEPRLEVGRLVAAMADEGLLER
jgi:Domain of unknown function (DUF4388)